MRFLGVGPVGFWLLWRIAPSWTASLDARVLLLEPAGLTSYLTFRTSYEI